MELPKIFESQFSVSKQILGSKSLNPKLLSLVCLSAFETLNKISQKQYLIAIHTYLKFGM